MNQPTMSKINGSIIGSTSTQFGSLLGTSMKIDAQEDGSVLTRQKEQLSDPNLITRPKSIQISYHYMTTCGLVDHVLLITSFSLHFIPSIAPFDIK